MIDGGAAVALAALTQTVAMATVPRVPTMISIRIQLKKALKTCELLNPALNLLFC